MPMIPAHRMLRMLFCNRAFFCHRPRQLPFLCVQQQNAGQGNITFTFGISTKALRLVFQRLANIFDSPWVSLASMESVDGRSDDG